MAETTRAGAHPGPPGAAGRRTALLCAILAAVTLVVFSPSYSNGFVYFDDNWYVAENALVQRGLTGEGLAWAFTNTVPYWQPMPWLSHMLDCHLFGTSAGAHHLTSAVIHALTSVLLLLLLARMTGDLWRSAFVASVFALHPLHVESVAWVAERKDVLAGLFFVLSLLAWTRFARGDGPVWYGLSLAIFALGLMSKPMVVTLPCVMLLLDWWPLRRLRGAAGASGAAGAGAGAPAAIRCAPVEASRLLLEKVPFFVLSIAASIVTFRGGGVVSSLGDLPIQSRLANSVIGYARYVAKAVWPSNLAVFYDRPAGAGLWLLGGAVLLVAVTAVAVRTARGRPHLIVGWLWFLGMLVPVIGIVQIWKQSIADRFMYLPLVGLLVMVAWSVPAAWSAVRAGRLALGAAAAACLALASAVTWRQLGSWRNTRTLFERALAVTVDNQVALNNVAWIYAAHPDREARRESEAMRLAERLRELSGPRDPDALDTLAVAYAAAGRYADAAAAAKEAIAIATMLGWQEEHLAPVRARLELYEKGQPYREQNHLITGAAPPDGE